MGTHFRSTWLTTSLDALKRRDLTTGYFAHLDERYRAVIKETVAATWLPADVAIAHYRAIDALGLTPDEQYKMGEEVPIRVYSGFIKLARAAGATPWTAAAHLGRLWDRSWIGGGIGVFRLGPKEGRIEIVGVPVCGISYVRHAMRGSYRAAASLFCTRAYVRDVPRLCTSSTLAYEISWA
jgi:hypothetical protein